MPSSDCGKLDQVESKWDPRASIGVVLAAGGYPGDYAKGEVISGLPTQESAGQKVFHAGTETKATKWLPMAVAYCVPLHSAIPY